MRKRSERRDWPSVIAKLNESSSGALRIRMGSPGSAQMTRIRLLQQWSNLRVHTEGAVLHLRLTG